MKRPRLPSPSLYRRTVGIATLMSIALVVLMLVMWRQGQGYGYLVGAVVWLLYTAAFGALWWRAP